MIIKSCIRLSIFTLFTVIVNAGVKMDIEGLFLLGY